MSTRKAAGKSPVSSSKPAQRATLPAPAKARIPLVRGSDAERKAAGGGVGTKGKPVLTKPVLPKGGGGAAPKDAPAKSAPVRAVPPAAGKKVTVMGKVSVSPAKAFAPVKVAPPRPGTMVLPLKKGGGKLALLAPAAKAAKVAKATKATKATKVVAAPVAKVPAKLPAKSPAKISTKPVSKISVSKAAPVAGGVFGKQVQKIAPVRPTAMATAASSRGTPSFPPPRAGAKNVPVPAKPKAGVPTKVPSSAKGGAKPVAVGKPVPVKPVGKSKVVAPVAKDSRKVPASKVPASKAPTSAPAAIPAKGAKTPTAKTVAPQPAKGGKATPETKSAKADKAVLPPKAGRVGKDSAPDAATAKSKSGKVSAPKPEPVAAGAKSKKKPVIEAVVPRSFTLAEDIEKLGGKLAGKAGIAQPAVDATEGGASADAAAAPATSAPASRAFSLRSTVHFTMDDVRDYLRGHKGVKLNIYTPGDEKPKNTAAKRREAELAAAHHQARDVGAASLADILGIPSGSSSADASAREEKQIPSKWQRYYKQLVAMRSVRLQGLDVRKEDAIRKTDADASESSSGYGQHLGDAGSESFDRDFALNLLSCEQATLGEIEEAINRMKNGTYGICEQTKKPIPADRLRVLPYARYTLEGQKEVERLRRARRGSALASPLIDPSEGIIGSGAPVVGETISPASINDEIL